MNAAAEHDAPWGQRWVRALENLSTSWQNRLPRGREYAAKGHVLSLSVTEGKITAKVQGSRSKPYTTTIELPPFRTSEWTRVIKHFASEARFPAQLLAGEMPEGTAEMLDGMGLNLFPVRNSEMIGGCNCPEKGRPCKHIAAVHYAFGEALDRDPFLLLQLRGAGRAQLIRGFRQIWTGESDQDADEVAAGDAYAIKVSELSADRFNRSPAAVEQMSFRIAPTGQPDLILRRLGAPKSWQLPITVFDILGPVYTETVGLASRIALSSEASIEVVDDDPSFEDPLQTTAEAISGAPFHFGELEVTSSISEALHDVELAPAPAAAAILPGTLTKRSAPAKSEPTKPEPEADAAPVLIRRGQSVQSRRAERARRVVEPEVKPKPAPAQPEPAAVPGPAIVQRRSGRRLMVVKPSRKSRKAAATERGQGLDAKLRKAMGRDDYRKALKMAVRLWQQEPTISHLLLLLSNANFDNQWRTTVRDEADRSLATAVHGGKPLQLAEFGLLIAAGKYGVVAEIMDARRDELWSADGCPAATFIAFTLRALTRKAKTPRPATNRLWEQQLEPIDDYPWSDDVPSVGEWLETAVKRTQVSPSERERMLEVAETLVLKRLEDLPRVPKGVLPVETYVLAIAEAHRALGDEVAPMAFLARAHAAIGSNAALGERIAAAIAESPALTA